VTYGLTESFDEVLIRDPLGEFTSLSQVTPNGLFAGPEFTFSEPITGLRFDYHSPVDFYITDPSGRRAGLDHLSGITFHEIPGARYDRDTSYENGITGEQDDDPSKSLEIFGIPDAEYRLTVVGTANGTYTGEVRAFDVNRDISVALTRDVPTEPGLVHQYTVTFAKSNGATTRVAGAFDGGGQRPRDVNRFLTYLNISASQTTVGAASSGFHLAVMYGSETTASSFEATLNGANVTSLFHPTPAGAENVALPLQRGRNVIILAINGIVVNRTATDRDRLVFIAP